MKAKSSEFRSTTWLFTAVLTRISNPTYLIMRWLILGGAIFRFFVMYRRSERFPLSEFYSLLALSMFFAYATVTTILPAARRNLTKMRWWYLLQTIGDTLTISAFYVLSARPQSDVFLAYFLPLMIAGENFKKKDVLVLFLFITFLFVASLTTTTMLHNPQIPLAIALLRDALPRCSFFVVFVSVILVRANRFKEQSEELEAVSKTVINIANKAGMRSRLRAVIDASVELLKAKGCAVYLKVPDKDVLRVVALSGIQSETYKIGYEVPISCGLAGEVWKRRETIIENDYGQYSNRIIELSNTFEAVIESPLMVGENPIGVLVVLNYGKRNKFKREDKPILERLAKYAAVAIYDMQLLDEKQGQAEEIKKQAQSLEVLNAASADMTKSLEIEMTLASIARSVWEISLRDNSEPAVVYVGLVIEQGEKKYLTFAAAHPDRYLRQLQDCPGCIDLAGETGGVVGRAIREGASQLISDVTKDDDYVNCLDDTVSELAVPIKSRDKTKGEDTVIGIINIEHRQKDAFSKALVKNVEILARQAGSAIQNDYLFEQIERQRTVAESLRSAFEKMMVVSSENLNQVASSILKGLVEVIPYDRATLQLIKGGRRRILAKENMADDQIDPSLLRPIADDKLISEIVRTREIKILQSVESDPDWETVSATSTVKSWVGMPLIYGGEVTGLITLDITGQEYSYKEDEREMLRMFANLAASVFQNALLFAKNADRMRELSQTKEKLETFLNDFESYGNLAIIGLVYGESIHFAKDRLGLAKSRAADILRGRFDHDLSMLKSKAHEIRTYINQYLDTLSESQKRVLPSPEPIDLENLIEQVVASKELGSNIEPYYYFQANDAIVYAPKQQLRQLLYVIVQNAIDAMNTVNKGTLIIKTRKVPSEEGHFLLVSVSDNGGGIPEDKRHNLFKIKATPSAGRKGSGMGLAWAFSFIRSYGGDISFKTRTGRGTSMYILVPYDFRSAKELKHSWKGDF